MLAWLDGVTAGHFGSRFGRITGCGDDAYSGAGRDRGKRFTAWQLHGDYRLSTMAHPDDGGQLSALGQKL